jgi:hypothetical protein
MWRASRIPYKESTRKGMRTKYGEEEEEGEGGKGGA